MACDSWTYFSRKLELSSHEEMPFHESHRDDLPRPSLVRA